MNDTDFEALKSIVATLKTSRKPFKFLYLLAAADGEPALVIKRKMPKKEVMEARKAAKKKQLAYGTVVANRTERRLEFFPEDEPPPKFAKHLKQEFGKTIPLLKKGKIMEAGTSPEDLDPDELLDQARKQRSDKGTELRRAKYKKSGRDRQHKLAIERASDATQRFAIINNERENLKYKMGLKSDRLATAETELSKFKWHEPDKKKRKAKDIKALKEQILDFATQLQQMQEDASIPTEELRAAHKALDVMEKAALEVEALESELAWADADVAYAQSLVAETDVEMAEMTFLMDLATAASKSPLLQKALDEADEADKAADTALDEALKLGNKVAKIEAAIDALEASGEDHATEILDLKVALQQATSYYEDAMELAEALTDKADAAQLAKDEAITVASAIDPEGLGKVMDELNAAEKKRDEAAQAHQEADLLAEEKEAKFNRHQALRQPNLVIEGTWISQRQFDELLATVPPTMRGVQFDMKKRRIGVGYDTLQFMQLCKAFVNALDKLAAPHKSGPGANKAEKITNAYGTETFKAAWFARRTEVSEEGRKVTESFDWDELEEKLPQSKLDRIDKELALATTPEEMLHSLLDDSDGFTLGEGHRDTDPNRHFLFDNLEEMVKQGVDTLYVEQLVIENQDDLDDWLAAPYDAPMPEPLKAALIAIGSSQSADKGIIKILEKAKRLGVNIQSIDTTQAKGDSDPTCDTEKDERVRRMLGVADKKMRSPKRKGKFVALVGTAHAYPHEGDPLPVPGIGELMGVPSVHIQNDQKDKKRPHIVSFDDAHHGVGVDPNPRLKVGPEDESDEVVIKI